MEKHTISRRDFIKISAVAGSLLVGGKLLSGLIGDGLAVVKESRLLMGTIINLAVVAESRGAAEGAIKATFAELERQVGIFNHRDTTSPLAILNRTGKLTNPPQELVQVLSQAGAISEMTNGAFDITIKPLCDLYSELQPNLPEREQLEAALGLVDYKQMSVSNQEIVFNRPGMAVTLDGIAKGYIVDSGTAVLKELGYANVYVEAGGDLMASGTKEGDLPWRIGIQSPRDVKPGLLTQIDISDLAAATSGDYFQFYSEDLRHHHIIDPRVGYSAPGLASATILSAETMLSDALATAVMVLGPEKGLRLIESLSSVEAYLVTKNLQVLESSGFHNKAEIPEV